MSGKARHLMDKLRSREFLESAADEALRFAKKRNRGARKFEENRAYYMDCLERMFRLSEFPTKEYRKMTIITDGKEREIYPLPFFPWSVIFHAVKMLLEPIAERVLIYDTSAGIRHRGQTFAAERVEHLVRKHRELTHFAKSDIRKFYPSIPHRVIIDTLRDYVDDGGFVDFVRDTILDYSSDIEGVLEDEIAKRNRYCPWADKRPLLHEERGIILGGCLSQMLGNLVLSRVDRAMTEGYHVGAYHRFCDDIVMLAHSQEEAEEYLSELDRTLRELGFVLKASSFAAPLKDEYKGVKGRGMDFVGYVFSRKNMRMRKRNKQRFARTMSRIKSKGRRKEILAAYKGIMMRGHCKNLWEVITGNRMSFRDSGIEISDVTDLGGKRYYHIPQVTVADILNTGIVVTDWIDGLTINGKKDRFVVVFEIDGVRKKFISSSSLLHEQLQKADAMEKDGKSIYPIETVVRRKNLGNGKSTYIFD